jgi:hypothetical protein
MPGRGSSASTAITPPAPTQRSCWRSTPPEARNRRTTHSSAAGRLAAYSTRPTKATARVTLPAAPPSANGLSTGTEPPVSCCEPRLAPTPAGSPGDDVGHHQPPAARPQPPVGQQQERQGDAEGDGHRPAGLPGDHGDLADHGQRPAVDEQRLQPGLEGDDQGPDQRSADGVETSPCGVITSRVPSRNRRERRLWCPKVNLVRIVCISRPILTSCVSTCSTCIRRSSRSRTGGTATPWRRRPGDYLLTGQGG